LGQCQKGKIIKQLECNEQFAIVQKPTHLLLYSILYTDAKPYSLTFLNIYFLNTMREKCKFTTEEKLKILQEADKNGLEKTLNNHHISLSLYKKWKNAFAAQGIDGFHSHHIRVDPTIRSLEKENKRLRKIIADMTLELERAKEEKEVERSGG
jgi:transposase-like protein